MNYGALLSMEALVLIPVLVIILGYVTIKLKQSQLIAPEVIFYVASLVYTASLYLPVWSVEYKPQIMGHEVLMIGWLGLIYFDPRWFCNFVVLLSAICVFRKANSRCQFYCFVLAVVGSSAIFGPYHADLQIKILPTIAIFRGTGLTWGGYLWIASLWLFAISAQVKNKT